MPAYLRYNTNEEQIQAQNDWVSSNLSPEEQASFLSACQLNNLLWESYQSQGLLIRENLYETVFVPEVNQNIEVLIGEKLVLATGIIPSQLQVHPDYAEWMNRLPNDIFNKNITLQD